ncbi:MAG: MOSC domain-containing protein [Thermoplasmata archaeon]|nr:MOSC domain-containing protein [Thermoplasmata archaeon]MCI4340871.1 MOSC domain-containing protein [Thermoplasmata archaeon]
MKSERPGERGLPKSSVEEVELEAGGVRGDFNRYRHELLADEPTSAVLVMPLEMLETLRAEGWPVAPGDLGENLTSSGVPYEELQPGVVLAMGSAAAQITRPCDPCRQLYGLPYVGKDRGPEFVRTLLGRRGWYARVLRPGRVRRGDAIRVTRT